MVKKNKKLKILKLYWTKWDVVSAQACRCDGKLPRLREKQEGSRVTRKLRGDRGGERGAGLPPTPS